MSDMVWTFAKRTLIAAAIIGALAFGWQVAAGPVSAEHLTIGSFDHDDD